MKGTFRFGQRVPQEYFVTSGFGESNNCRHAGSYHKALATALIDGYNIMNYSSILPMGAIEKPMKPREQRIHGAVMEVIMARADGKSGETITAGLGYAWLKDEVTGETIGGIVAERKTKNDDIEARLEASLREIHKASFSQYEMGRPRILKRSLKVSAKYGTVINAICFTSYKQDFESVEWELVGKNEAFPG